MVSRFVDKLRWRIKLATSSTSHPAGDRVLQTYELLELILGHLDPQSLRQAQVVNRYWQTIIHKSSLLQARLYLPAKVRCVRPFLIGAAGGIGIDNVVTCFICGLFSDAYNPTWEPYFRHQILVDGERWIIEGDSGGYIDEHHSHIPAMFGQSLAHSDTYMLFYSVSCRESFESLEAWLEELESPTEPLSMLVTTLRDTERKRKLSHKHNHFPLHKCLPAAVVSTKNDLPSADHLVASSEGAALARKLGCPFVETSAKTGAGVEEAFAEMCRAYKRTRLEQIRQQSKRSSLIKATSPSTADAKEREERKSRWWRRYRLNQRLT